MESQGKVRENKFCRVIETMEKDTALEL